MDDTSTGGFRVRSNDVFISYSRQNREFVRRLVDTLKQQSRDPWVDWEDIPNAVEWWKRVEKGIEGADTFVFVLSPDSVTSVHCRKELAYAVHYNKRLVPIVCQEVEDETVPLELRKINWIFFNQGFDSAFKELVDVINTDLAYVEYHTYLLERALAWEREARNSYLLLRGKGLRTARDWVIASAGKNPQPALVQTQFMVASGAQDTAERRRKYLYQFLGVGLAFLLVFLGLLSFNGVVGEIRALVSSLEGNQELDALIVGLKAGEKLKHSYWLNGLINWSAPDLQVRTVTALQQEVNNLREVNRLEQHQGRVFHVSFSPDGQFIASASLDRSMRLWKADGTPLKPLLGHTDAVVSVAFNPGSTVDKAGVKRIMLASGSYDHNVKLWQIDSHPNGTVKAKLFKTLTNEGHTNKVLSVRSDPGGTFLASASLDGTVKLWTWQGELRTTLRHAKPGVFINGVSFSQYGNEIATAGNDGTVKLWKTTGELIGTLKHDRSVLSVSFSPDGQLVVSGDTGGILKLWRPDRTNLTLQKHEDAINRITFSPDGQLFASASDDGTVRLWQRNGKLVRTLRGHQGAVYRVQFSPDARTIATAGADGTIKLWSQADGVLLDSLEGHRDEVLSIDFSPARQGIIASASADSTVKLWKVDGSVKIFPHSNRVYDVSFRPNDKIFASSSFKTIKLWSQSGTLISNRQAHDRVVNSVSFSPDKGILASGGIDIDKESLFGTVKLWRLSGSNLIRIKTLKGHEAAVTNVSFIPEHPFLASASEDRTVKFWHYPDGKLVQSVDAKGPLTSVSFNPNGALMLTTSKASGGSNGSIKLWRLEFNRNGNGIRKVELLKTLDNAHRGDVMSASFSPNGQLFATAGSDQTVRLWYQDSSPMGAPLTGHTKSVSKVSFSPDGNLLASASQDGTVKLWTTRGTLITTLKRHRREVSSVSFSSDSKTLVSASYDNEALLWTLPDAFDHNALDKLLQQGCDSARDYLSQNPNATKDNTEIGKFCQKEYPPKSIRIDLSSIQNSELAEASRFARLNVKDD